MLQRLRESLTLALLALLPLHAIGVTVATKLFVGAGHAPLTAIALWKEALLGLVGLLGLLELAFERKKRETFGMDLLDALVLFLFILSLILLRFTDGDLRSYLFGFRYDFVPLVAFVVLRRVRWSEVFADRLFLLFLGLGTLVSVYGFFTLVLPESFFRALGYSDLHSLYLPGGPIAAFQNISNTSITRIQSTMSGPNQLGLWLLIPWSASLLFALKRLSLPWSKQILPWALFLLCDIALLLTFSRAAWISAIVIFFLTLKLTLLRRAFLQWTAGALLAVGAVLLCIAFTSLMSSFVSPLHEIISDVPLRRSE